MITIDRSSNHKSSASGCFGFRVVSIFRHRVLRHAAWLLLCCAGSLAIAEERTLTPEQMEALANTGELETPAPPSRPSSLPDLTKGEWVRDMDEINVWNLGPTGAVGYLVGGFTGDQIQVLSVTPGSPAAGKLQWGDVILGANGKDFVAGEHNGYALGNAIIESEKQENGGLLTLRVWRDRNFIKRNGAKDIGGIDVDELFDKARDDNSLYDWKPDEEQIHEAEHQRYEEFPLDGYYTEVELKLRVLPPYS